MSWLFSQALVAEYLGESCLDGEPSAQLSGNPTQQAYLSPDKMTVFSRLSRFGMTFKPLTEDRGEALLTSYLAAFHAKTSPLPEKAQESTESAAECGDTWRGSLAKFDPATSSWKTVQHSLLGDSDEFSVTWPRSGMTANGQCWELPILVHRTSGTDSGLWRTPGAQDGMRGTYASKETMDSRLAKGGQLSLANQVKHPHLWPTPTASTGGANHASNAVTQKGHGINLLGAVMKWLTPTARDYKSGTGAQDRPGHSPPLSNVIGGTLNPTWVEWLMGWPLGWTDLKPLEMDKSHCALQQHGGY